MRKLPPNAATIAPLKPKPKTNSNAVLKIVERLKKMAKMKSAFCTSLQMTFYQIPLVYVNPKMGISRPETQFRLKNQTFCRGLFGPPDFLSLTLPPFED
jgi:hypothetical protein